MARNYTVASHPGKPGYHRHVYPDGHWKAVKGSTHSLAEEGGGGGSAPAPDPYTAPPPDPELLQRQIAGQQSLQIGDAWDTYQKGVLSNTYGIGDTSNPYSRAKLLEDSYRKRQGSTLNNYASQGQLYSGALNKQMDEDQFQHNIDNNNMQRSYYDSLANIEKGRIDRYASTGQALDQAQLNSILQALQGLR